MEIALKQPETLLANGDMLAIGTFRCSTADPMFADSGPCSGNVVVFPRRVVEIQLDDGRSFIGDPTVVPLYNRGQRYRRRAISSADHSDWIALGDALLEELREWSGRAIDVERPFRRSHVAASSSLYLEQRQLFEALLHDFPPGASAAEEAALGIVIRALGAVMTLREEKRDDRRTRAAKALIASRIASNLPLRDIASAAGVSPFRLCRIFKASTGMTLTGYRNELRLRLSLQRLSRPAADILEIATSLGFSSHSHFGARFARRFGLTPSQFREGVRPRMSGG